MKPKLPRPERYIAEEINFEQVRRELEQASKTYKSRFRLWTEQDLQLLTEFYGRVATALLAKKLGRSAHSLRIKASELGIHTERKLPGK